jgi:hypothetical protein
VYFLGLDSSGFILYILALILFVEYRKLLHYSYIYILFLFSASM